MINDNKTVVEILTRIVVFFAIGDGVTTAGPYRNEYVFTITVHEAGNLADNSLDFLDSKAFADIQSRLEMEAARSRPEEDAL